MNNLSASFAPWIGQKDWQSEQRKDEVQFHDTLHKVLQGSRTLWSYADFRTAMTTAYTERHGPVTAEVRAKIADFARRAGAIAQYLHDTEQPDDFRL